MKPSSADRVTARAIGYGLADWQELKVVVEIGGDTRSRPTCAG